MSSDSELILTINAGSSSLRFALFEFGRAGEGVLRGRIGGLGGKDPVCELSSGQDGEGPSIDGVRDLQQAVAAVTDWLIREGYAKQIIAIGHRIVHGGDRAGPARIDDALLTELEGLNGLAPLHQPYALDAIRALRAALSDCSHVACFDTSFHQTMLPPVRCYALPAALADRPLVRYGFHGLSFEYIARVLPAQAPRARRAVVAHLGSGASMCALAEGHSVDTSMGMTPLDGLPMGTRSGAVDPGLLLWLLQSGRHDPERLAEILYRQSGLLALSGVSSDMRTLLESDAPGARLAVEVFAYRSAQTLASLVVALGGLDALVFTGGIGERAPAVRATIARHCGWMGVELDEALNSRNASCISTADAAVSTWVIPTDEERVIADHTEALLPRAS